VNDVPDASYERVPSENDDSHVFVSLPLIEGGEYRAEVIPLPGTDPTATFSLYFLDGGVTDTLALAAGVGAIPPGGYAATAAPTVQPPTTLTAEPGGASIALRWQPSPSSDVAGYKILYGTLNESDRYSGDQAAEGESGIEVPAGQTAFTLTCLPDSVFHVAIQAFTASGHFSEWSNEAVAHPGRIIGVLDADPNTLNLKSLGRWITTYTELDGGYDVARILNSSVRLNGTIAPDLASASLGDHDSDGRPDLTLKFSRPAVESSLPQGSMVSVCLSGRVLGCPDTLAFDVCDSIRVIRPVISAPVAGMVLPPRATYVVRWTSPDSHAIDSVAVLYARDSRSEWQVLAHGIPDGNAFAWTTPDSTSDSSYVAVGIYQGKTLLGVGVAGPFMIGNTTAVEDVNGGAPKAFALYPMRPNPFNSTAAVSLDLPVTSDVHVRVFDVSGRLVATLASGPMPAGRHTIHWRPVGVSSGVYFCEFDTRTFRTVERVLLLR
jgi:hypothetical protein